MARSESAPGNTKKKRKSASQGAAARANATPKREVPPAAETAETPPFVRPVGRLERTRRLILAALRVWELKRKIRD